MSTSCMCCHQSSFARDRSSEKLAALAEIGTQTLSITSGGELKDHVAFMKASAIVHQLMYARQVPYWLEEAVATAGNISQYSKHPLPDVESSISGLIQLTNRDHDAMKSQMQCSIRIALLGCVPRES